ncbi:MAG TPA: DUF1592 domain-containing protein [Pirellulaceae bacterium]|nr:DUF1592 domain-containing protein [Pirellulaceae bacterium]
MFSGTIRRLICLACVIGCPGLPAARGSELDACPSTDDGRFSAFFETTFWPKVAESECLTCHKSGGEAEDSQLVLSDLNRLAVSERADGMRANRDAFLRAALRDGDQGPTLLLKATGKLEHGGGEVLAGDSAAFALLAELVGLARGLPDEPTANRPADPPGDAEGTPFFDGVAMVDDVRLLRRVTLSLAGRLPTDAERTAVRERGSEGLSEILDALMREEAFYDRLREAFNDLFLTQGVDGNPDQTVLSYEHFEMSRQWYQHYDLSHLTDEQERLQAGYKLAREYRAALLDEPMRLVDYIVRNDRPFTEIVTADYILVSPYTARGYGIFDQVKDRFVDPDDPFEFRPVTLDALRGRSERENQESLTGRYPHAGLLSTFQYLSRYPTTETNRNRLRARMVYRHFLGVDVLELAARVSDAAAVTARYQNPTMEASECVVCHRTLDPLAGLFQDYWRFDPNFAIYGRRPEGWFDDMFVAGFEEETLPSDERWRALPWLGERIAEDPRFAETMVGHAWYLLSGRRPMSAPKDLSDPLHEVRWRAYREQQQEVRRITERFVASNYDFREAIAGWVMSEFYRADGAMSETEDPSRLTELEEVGVVRMLSPEQLERKVAAIFGSQWGGLTEQTALLYGGIDSKEVTERATDPGGAMGAIQRMLSNEVACRNVARDFLRPARERLLFPEIEPDTLPGVSAEDDARIRAAIVHLHRRILGREDDASSPEVQRTFGLFGGLVAEAAARKGLEPREIYHCRPDPENTTVDDPHYTIRAWRAVVTYLLRQHEFLYE